MIKSKLINKIAEQHPNLTTRDVERVVDSILDTITGAMCQGKRVELRGFGAFSVRKRDQRKGRNPRTGETVEVKAKHVPFYKMGKDMKDRLNA